MLYIKAIIIFINFASVRKFYRVNALVWFIKMMLSYGGKIIFAP